MTYDNSLVIKAPSVQVKSWHSGQNTVGTYTGFYNMKQLGVLLHTTDEEAAASKRLLFYFIFCSIIQLT